MSPGVVGRVSRSRQRSAVSRPRSSGTMWSGTRMTSRSREDRSQRFRFFFWTHNTEVDQADCVSLVHHKTVGVEEEWNQVLRQGWTKCSGYPHLSISIILPPSLCSPPVVSWLWLWMDHMCGPGGKGERWVDFSTPIEQSPPGCDGAGIRTISFARSAD